MIAAHRPRQRPADAKLLVVTAEGRLVPALRTSFMTFLRPGDLVIANDAATLPASLRGTHLPSGAPIEVRLAGRSTLAAAEVRQWRAIVFGTGDFRQRTEDRPAPPALVDADRLALGPLRATIVRTLGHPRFIALAFDGTAAQIWAGIGSHGRPIQYAHVQTPLALWDVWTPIAAPPVAFEPPSAGFLLDWRLLGDMRERGIAFATLTHAAGISSTGDPALDRTLPFDEAYFIPKNTVRVLEQARRRGGRIVAIGTTVVRALEHAATQSGSVRPGPGIATQRIDARTSLSFVDAIVSGTHEPGTSHYDLLRAFQQSSVLDEMNVVLAAQGYRRHEFGDFVLVERDGRHRARASTLDECVAA